MKKISMGFVTALFLLPSLSFGASTAATKNEVSVPCYNGGYTFGLAGYSAPLSVTPDVNSSVNDVRNDENNENQSSLKSAEYR